MKSTHPTTVKRLKPEELARSVALLRYEELAQFLEALSEELDAEAESERRRDRPRLWSALKILSYGLKNCTKYAQKVWQICKPHTL